MQSSIRTRAGVVLHRVASARTLPNYYRYATPDTAALVSGAADVFAGALLPFGESHSVYASTMPLRAAKESQP